MPDTRSAQFRVAEPGEAEATSQQRRDHRAIAGLCTWDVYDWVAMTPGSTCWWWTGSHDDRAGRPRWRHTSARRVVWLLVNGPVPDGATITNSCGNTACVNPDHLLARLPDGTTRAA